MTNEVIFDLEQETFFKIKISMAGSTNLPNVNPIIRFIISEAEKKDIAIMLPTFPAEGGVSVKVPILKNIFTENTKYIGKLEIIFGNRYFSPISFPINFKKEIEISAEPIFENNLQLSEKNKEDHEKFNVSFEISKNNSIETINKNSKKEQEKLTFDEIVEMEEKISQEQKKINEIQQKKKELKEQERKDKEKAAYDKKQKEIENFQKKKEILKEKMKQWLLDN